MRRLVFGEVARKNRYPEQYAEPGNNELPAGRKWWLSRNEAEEADQEALKLEEKRGEGASEISARVEQMTEADRQADKEKSGERGTNLRDGDEEVVPSEKRCARHGSVPKLRPTPILVPCGWHRPDARIRR